MENKLFITDADNTWEMDDSYSDAAYAEIQRQKESIDWDLNWIADAEHAWLAGG